MTVHVLWLKKDLRLHDHAPLTEAARLGVVVPLYVYEPEVVHAATFEASHLQFLNQSLTTLRHTLRQQGAELFIRQGPIEQVLDALRTELGGIAAVWSHEETGDWASYQRDLRLRAWLTRHGIPWHELPTNAVVRRLKSRDTWTHHWTVRMTPTPLPAPKTIQVPPTLKPGEVLSAEVLGVQPTQKTMLQPGGEFAAKETLNTFLSERGLSYSRHMSAPDTAEHSCSRLSPYLAFGNLSLRQVVHAVEDRRRWLQDSDDGLAHPDRSAWLRTLTSFEKRLYWHCHFIQKLEDEPEQEFQALHPLYRNLWDTPLFPLVNRDAHLTAWATGTTGLPMVDACMRAVQATGWLNFRMRAMLISVASAQLWLPWQQTAPILARHFLDYEPGIHYPQVQMQSGTTGINTLRLYSAAKQGQDQDPTGTFIRHWVPELAELPLPYLFEPHTAPPLILMAAGIRLGDTYPYPVMGDPKAAYKAAQQRLWAVRKHPHHGALAQPVIERHASRMGPMRSRRRQ